MSSSSCKGEFNVSIKVSKYLEGYRNKYSVDYFTEDEENIHLFDFDEKEVFSTGESGTSSFYTSTIRGLLEEFKIFEKVENQLNMEKKSFERMILHGVEDFYEHKFKDDFLRKQYRIYLRKQKEDELAKNRIYYEEEYGETFNDEEHFKKWYINIINYNYNTEFITYDNAKKFHKSEGWRKRNENNNVRPYGFTEEEAEIFNELFKIGFNRLAKKYHPDVSGDDGKMKLLISLKEKIINNCKL